MNWIVVGAIALAMLAVLGIGGAVLGTGPSVSVTPGVAVAGVAQHSEARFDGPSCTPGTWGCQ